MDAGGKSAPAVRVVVLSRDTALAWIGRACSEAQRMRIVSAPSAFEAAAEILAEPTAALLIDFRAMGHQDIRLLGIARQMDVALLGIGTLPGGFSTDELSGVRLVSRKDLPAALARIAAEQLAPAKPPVRLTPAKKPKPLTTAPDRPQDQSQPTDPNDAPPAGGLLSPEELSALLEDEP